MFRLVVVCALWTLVAGQTKYCCMPEQWEGNIGLIQGAVQAGNPLLYRGAGNISYDYTNERLAIDTLINFNGENVQIKTISNYKTKMFYIITDNQCTPLSMTGDMVKLCVPDNAIPAGKVVYGFKSSKLNAMAYSIPNIVPELVNPFSAGPDSAGFLTTTVGNPCAPITEVVYGSRNQSSAMTAMEYSNISPGISNPSVFVPPSSCFGKTTQKRAPAIPDHLMDYIHSRVTQN